MQKNTETQTTEVEMMRTKQAILSRLCEIECELSDLHEANKYGSFDMDGNKRRNLSEEYVFLSRQLSKVSEQS